MEQEEVEVEVEVSARTWQCEVCGKLFTFERCYETHRKWKHRVYQCASCQMIFSRAFNLKRHEKNCKRDKQKVKCPLCDFTGSAKSIVCEHLVQIHDKNLNEKTLEFTTFENFEKWKNLFEKTTKASFVKNSSMKVLKSGLKICKYVCHRDGYFKSRSKGIRRQKNLGSNKINSCCPAEINVVVSDKRVNIKYVDTHLGHENDLARLLISDAEKKKIAQKLALKIPFNEILGEIRESATNESELDRVHLLTRKDLWNIVNSFHLNHESVLDKNGCSNLDAWVKQMQVSSNLIRCYKREGITSEIYPELRSEDFFLVLMNDAQLEVLKQFGGDCICIDGTHAFEHVSSDFQLFSLMVLDNVGQGFPCSFLFCNRADTIVLTLFFKVIKKCLSDGLISPKTFMSDLDETFYGAWSEVFGPVSRQLYGSWHLERAWRNNLNRIDDLEKQLVTYKKLKNVLDETDEHTFIAMLNNLNNELINDPDTSEFGKYFEKYIASCCRKECGINNNMNLENMHRIIKYIYFVGNKDRTMDAAIFLLMRFIRDKLFDRLVLDKKKISKKLSDIRKRHKGVLNLNSTITKDGACWNVGSPDNEHVYQVERVCQNCECELRCSECQVCIHNFACTCVDYSIKWNMCIHIHILCSILETPDVVIYSEQDLYDPNIFTIPEVSAIVRDERDSSFPEEMTTAAVIMCSEQDLCVANSLLPSPEASATDVTDEGDGLFNQKKSALMETFLNAFINIRNEKQLDAVAEQLAPLNQMVTALANEADTSQP